MASVVIRIGRNRDTAAENTASLTDIPSLLALVGKLNDQDTILGNKVRISMIIPISLKTLIDWPVIQRLNNAPVPPWYRQQDDKRINQALELCRQYEVDQDNGKDECKHEAGAAFTIIPALPTPNQY